MSRLGAALALALALGAGGPGCVSPRGLPRVATAALWTAAIAGHVVILVDHDAHFHGEHCGHYRRWHDDRWVYYYDGRWEYYDEEAGAWYHYTDDSY